uniref:Uncharacterized protein n=1 Tax=Tetraselmis sp. GSL018 TaxID=582737 RepID=A0A061SIF9_9CHLO
MHPARALPALRAAEEISMPALEECHLPQYVESTKPPLYQKWNLNHVLRSAIRPAGYPAEVPSAGPGFSAALP